MGNQFLEQRISIKFCVKLGKNANEVVKNSSIFEWHKWFIEFACRNHKRRQCSSHPSRSRALFALESFHKAKQLSLLYGNIETVE
jgi:hypothetical protein